MILKQFYIPDSFGECTFILIKKNINTFNYLTSLKKTSKILFKNTNFKQIINLSTNASSEDQSDALKKQVIDLVARSHSQYQAEQSNNLNATSALSEVDIIEHYNNHIGNLEEISNLIPPVLHQIVFDDEENLLNLSDRTDRLIQRQAYQNYLDGRPVEQNQDSTISTEPTEPSTATNGVNIVSEEESSSESGEVIVLLDNMDSSLSIRRVASNSSRSTNSNLSVDTGSNNHASIDASNTFVDTGSNNLASIDASNTFKMSTDDFPMLFGSSTLIPKEEILIFFFNTFTEYLNMFILLFKIFNGKSINLKSYLISMSINKSCFYLLNILYQILLSFFG